jgi:hypothetical protein
MQISRISQVGASTMGPATTPHSYGSPNTTRVSSLNASYSTTVAGKNYSLNVEESGGTYVASVPNPPAVTATGSSPQSAEDNLDIKLDTLA